MRRIFQTLAQIMGEQMNTPPDLIAPDTDVSRLRFQELAAAALACEKIFHVTLEDERIGDLKTVEDWVTYIKEKKADEQEHYTSPTDQDRESWLSR